jgi:parvulin-like peptidyl-prolyl isomerase
MLKDEQRSSYDSERRLHEEIWNEIVMQALIDQEIKKRKISYTDKELVNYMVSSPVQGAFQAPIFQNPDGSFSIEKYKQFIMNPDNLKDPRTAEIIRSIEVQARNSLPIMKLQQMVAGGIVVSDSSVRQRWLQDNEQIRIEFVYLPATRASTNDRPVDPKAVEAYYNEHKNDYKREEMRSLDIVFFPLAPTERDSADVLDRAKVVAERIRKGEDFAELANGYSEDPGNKDQQGKGNGGDLGFITRGRMVKEFEDVAFNLKPGEIGGPFLTRFGYHIVKTDSVKYSEPAPPSDKKAKAKAKNTPKEISAVKVRHILFKIEPSTLTRESAENAANRFHDAALKEGADFSTVAQREKLQPERTPLFKKDDQYIPYIGGNCTLLVHRVFGAKSGEVLPRYMVDTGFFVMRVAEVKHAGIPPLPEIRTSVEADCRKQFGEKAAAEFAARILERMKSGMTLQTAAQADTVKTAEIRTETVSRAGSVAGLGIRSPLVARAFSLRTIGENTGVVVTPDGAGIAVLVGKLPLDEARFSSDREQLKQRIESELQNEVISRFLDNLKKSAKITDNRSQIYIL